MKLKVTYVALLLAGTAGCLPPSEPIEVVEWKLSTPGKSGVRGEARVSRNERVIVTVLSGVKLPTEKGRREYVPRLTVYLDELRSPRQFQLADDGIVLMDSRGRRFALVRVFETPNPSFPHLHFRVERPKGIAFNADDYWLDLKIRFHYRGEQHELNIPKIRCAERMYEIDGPILR